MHSPALKTEFTNVPVHIPRAWRDIIARLAAESGATQNAIYQLIIRIGTPIAAANLARLQREIKKHALKVAEGESELTFRHILALPDPGKPAKMTGK
jgi:hypothetical protein